MVFSAATPYPSIMWCAHFIMSYNGEGFYWQAHMKWNGHTFSISGVNQYQRIQRWDEMRWWSKCREFKVYGVVMIIYSVSPHMVHDEMEWDYWRRGAVTTYIESGDGASGVARNQLDWRSDVAKQEFVRRWHRSAYCFNTINKRKHKFRPKTQSETNRGLGFICSQYND